jgi:hypothetical protein
MSCDSFERDATRRLHLPNATSSDTDDVYQAFDLPAYYGEVIPNLVFRFKDGTRIAKAYHWLGEVVYEPGLGIRLVYADAVFTIRGRNLSGLFTVVSEHGVKLIREADRAASFLVPENQPLVEAIERVARHS